MKIVIIGAGNLATRLSIELNSYNIDILQVYSRTVTSALSLAKKLGCNYTTDIKKVNKNADLYIVSISDGAIKNVLKQLPVKNKLIVHTAGSVSIDILKDFSDNYGVFYPLQTFSRTRKVDFKKIPICIEANNTNSLKNLTKLGKLISNDVRTINSEERKHLHLSAVFACNFVNHMYSIANELLKEKDIPFDIIRPLIEETALKINKMQPKLAQTGPAVRNDSSIINKHAEMMKLNTKWKKLYNSISESIFEYHKKQ